jgi:PAS domain S-box-containing protein
VNNGAMLLLCFLLLRLLLLLKLQLVTIITASESGLCVSIMKKKNLVAGGNLEGGKSEEYLRLLIESATDYAIFTLDKSRLVTTWNTGAEALTGYSEHEIIGQLADILYTTEDRHNRVPEIETETADKEGRALNERWHVRKDGSQFWGSGSISPLRDNDGRLLGFVKIMRDLTERKEAEERYAIRLEQEVGDRTTTLKESREQFASLVENTPDYITRWNKDLKLIFANTAFKTKTGVPNETLLGKTNSEMGEARETAIPFVTSLRKAFETDKAIEHYNSFSTPAGEVHFYTKMIPEKKCGWGDRISFGDCKRYYRNKRGRAGNYQGKGRAGTGSYRSVSHTL